MTHVGPGGIVQFRFDHKAQERVHVVGDFNDWDERAHPMDKIGEKWILIIKLFPGEYKFRYKAGKHWYNDKYPDKFEKWKGNETSVIVVDSE